MSLSDKSISKKSKLARHIQAALLGGVALSAGFTSTSVQAFMADGHCSGIPGDPDCDSNSSGGSNSGGNSGTTDTKPTIDLDTSASGTGSQVSFSEGGSATSIAPNASVNDDGTISSITITLVNPANGTSEGLTVSANAQNALGGIGGAVDINREHSISITNASATPAQVSTFLKAITYDNLASSPGESQRTLSVVINDGTQDSETYNVSIDVTDVNVATTSSSVPDTTTGANLSPGIVFGGGAEKLIIKRSLDANAKVIGGAGIDELVIADGSSVDISRAGTLSGFEKLTVESSSSRRVTLSYQQHSAFSEIALLNSNGLIMKGEPGHITAIAEASSYWLTGGTLELANGTFELDVYSASTDETVVLNNTQVKGRFSLGEGQDKIVFAGTTDTRDANFNNANAETLEFKDGLQLSVSSNSWRYLTENVVQSSAEGIQTFDIAFGPYSTSNTFNTIEGVENYNLVECSGPSNASIRLKSDAAKIDASRLIADQGTCNYNNRYFFDSPEFTGQLIDTNLPSFYTFNQSLDISKATLPSSFSFNAWGSDEQVITMAPGQLGSITSLSLVGNASKTFKVSGDGDVDLSATRLTKHVTFELLDDSRETRKITLSSNGYVSVVATAPSDAVTIVAGESTAKGYGTFKGELTAPDTLELHASNIALRDFPTENIHTLSLGSTESTQTLELRPQELVSFKKVTAPLSAQKYFKLSEGGTYNWQDMQISGVKRLELVGYNNDFNITLPDIDNGESGEVQVQITTQGYIVGDHTLTLNASAFSKTRLDLSATEARFFDGNDVIIGGAAADSINAGTGADTVTGGAGNDLFYGNKAQLNGDTITDLSIGDSIRVLDASVDENFEQVRFNGADVLEIDTESTGFNNPAIRINLSNSIGNNAELEITNRSPLTITVVRPNTAPGIFRLPDTLPYTENANPVSIAPQAVIFDIDLDEKNQGIGNYAGTTLTVSRTGGADSTDVFANLGDLGSLVTGLPLVYRQQVVGTVINNAQGELKLSFNSSATTSIATNVLRNISYQSSSEHPDESIALKITFNDGKADNSGNSQVNLSVTRLNDAPTDITWTLESGVTLPLKQSLLGEYNISNPGALLTLSATDVDMTDNHIFTLVYSGQGAQGCDNTTTSKSFLVNDNVLYVRKDAEPKEHPVCVTATDSAGAVVRKKLLINIIDDVAPSVDSVSLSRDSYGDSQKRHVAFKFHGATDVAFDYTYVISSENGGEVSANGQYALASSLQNKNIDISSLKDGKITLAVTLRDSLGNISAPFTTTAVLDTTAPNGFNAALNKTLFNEQSAAQASFDISAAEIGAQFNYSITSSKGGPAVTGSGIIESATQTISPVDLRGLNDGELTLSVTLTDVAGNTSAAQTSFARLDSSAPGIATFKASLAKLNKDGTAVVDIVLAEPSVDFDISDLEAAGGSLTGFTKLSATVYQVTYVPAVNSSTAGSLKIKAGVFTDAAGNTNTAAPVLNFDIDTQAPNQPNVVVSGTAFNKDTIKDGLFRLLGAEQGATYQWTMQSLSGHGAINTAEQVVRFDSDSNGIQNMNDGTLSLSVTVVDGHGNESQPFTQDIVYENVKPVLDIVASETVFGRSTVNFEFTVSEAISGFEHGDLQASSGSFSEFKALGNNRYSAQYTAAADISGAVTVSVAEGAFADKAGNKVALTSKQFNVDTQAPTGYAVTMDKDIYNSSASSIRFDLSGGEAGATYAYTLSSDGHSVSGTGTLDSAQQQVVIADIENLNDGPLSLSVTLTDKAGNAGVATIDTATLDTVAPSGHDVTLDQQTYNLANRDAASFSFSGAEVGATYAYTLTSTGGGELTGTETITAANQQVNITNLSQLKDGTLSLSVVLTDSAGNAAQALVKQAKLDATAPTITTLSASQTALKAGETSVITIGLSEAVVDFNKTSLNVAGGTVSELEQISDTSYRTVFTPSENSQAAGTITIAAGKFNDAAGNPNKASDTLTLNIDTQAPGNHSVAFGAPYYHGTNANAASITLSDAEVGTRYHYVISSTQGGLPVSAQGDVTESNQTISGINLSNLNDGQLNVTVTLTDPAGNVSEVASGTAILDTAAPQVVSLKSNDLALKAGEQAQITIVLSEPSADFTLEDIVASSGSLSEFKALNATTYQATFTPDTNVEGDVTISIAAGVFNDTAGNANTAAQPLVLSQDTTAPSGQSVSIDQTLINRDNETAMSFTLNGLEGKGMLTYQVSDGTTSVGSQSPISITAATQSVTGIDVSALAEGRLILTVVVYDDANNAGEPVTAAVTKKYNVAPVLSGTPHTTVNEDAEYVFEPQLTDPDSDDTHTFVISNKPDWASFDEQTGKLSGMPGDEHVGNYEQIVITVNDGKAEHALSAFNIEVVNTNDAPVAQDFSFTLDEAEQLVIASQQGLLSTAADDDLDSGDSLNAVVVSQPQFGTLLLNADGSFTYTHDGSENHSDSFTYQVKDAAGELSQTRNVALTINPLADAPVTLDDTLTVTEDTPNTLDLLENDSDAENDMVAASAAVVTEPQLGSYTITNGKLTYTPNENATGQDTLTYTVKDAAGNTSKAATLTISIVAVNDQPVAKGATLTVEEDTPSDELDVRTLSSDIEDTHPQGEVALSVLPTKGVVTVNQESGKLVYTPNANATGSDAFSYTIADSEGLVSEPVEVIVNIGAVNDRPMAAGDSVTLNEDETGTLNILDNDTDVEDQGFNGANVMLEDKGNGAGAYTLADVAVLADGQLEITPKADVNGSFSFTYTLMDSEGLSSEPATVNVDITPVNDAPVATDNTAQLEEEGSYEVNVLGDDYDVDANDQLDPSSVTVIRQPQSGQVTVTDSGAIVYVPNANFNGLDTFTYTVKDAAGAVSNEALVTMTVTPVNDAPVADAQVLNVSEDGSVLITLTATDIDADALSYQIVQGVNSGTLTQQSENSWLYTPDTDFNGEDSLQFVAFDGQAESEPVQVTLNVTAVNDTPEISGTPSTSVDQDTAYRFTPDATDLDGDSLTFSIENQPVWANFDAQSGTLSGTPGRDDVGNYANIVISVSDGELTASLPAFAIDVGYVNAKPAAQGMQVFVNEDASTSFSAPVSDPDQDSLSISVIQQPSNGTLSVQGTLFSYIPGANFNGTDSFSYVVNDGEMNSDEAQVSITVNAVNDMPVAQNDAFSFSQAASSYSLDVLANDSDVDAGDTLTLVGASASIGSVSISDGQLVYQPQASAQDTAVITYMLADSAGARAQANATVEITASSGIANAPTLTVPDDLSLDATGLFTKVDLGTAAAFDSNGNPLAVSLVDGVTIFAPGLHQVYWKATDGNDQSTVKKQTVAVNPLVSLSKDSQIAEEQSHTVKVFLNGPAPSYPVTVPYTVSGSANGNDHDLIDGEVVIESGTEASITFNVFADGTVEGNESIVITLADSLNRGAKHSTTVTVVEDNVAPALSVDTTQNGQARTLIVQGGEPVVIVASATDANPQDSISYSWQAADAQMLNLSVAAERFEFDPSVLAAGVYKLSVTATDDGTPALSSTQDVYLEIVASLPQLSSVDSDGDLIPDDQEGFADSDNDGIPDYLDANGDCNVIPGQVKDTEQYLVEGEPGVCLRKGATVAQNTTGGAQLLETELPEDTEATNIGGVFDFIATGLPKAGDVYGIVIPQRKPIPVNAIYRKFRDGEWVNFVTTDGNAVLSATGEPGYCPPPGSNEWRDGLNEGDWCVQLQIVDGGPNDDDGIANRSVVDPGGIAVLKSDNTQPVAQADTLILGAGLSVFIDVLENDLDADADALTITGASVDFGDVEILDNQLRYTPPVDYVGTAIITYSIADGQGGTSSATVTVELVVNAAPVTQQDTASTNDKASVIIDVLANDMDPDGDALTLISATAAYGKAVVNLDGTLSYEPKLGFNGEDTVTYQVKDSKGAVSDGIAKVTVTAHQVASVENKSSGSLGGLLMVMVSALVLRRRKSALPAYAVVTASCLVSAPALADAWRVQATLGQAEANSQFSALPAGTQVSNVDDSSQSWSAGAFYQLMPKWYAGLRYIDLGQGRVTLSGSTLTPDSWHQSMARVAPVLPEGFALQTGLEVARFDKVHGELFLGAYNWDYQIESTLNGRHLVQYEQKGTSAYFGGAVGYQLSGSTALTLSYSHYRLSANRIGEVAAGIEVRF
ncbi:tandem-95 repeat protein [Pseudoalteromonas rubra]|uniref:Dystroglycan-type cadherin-like domain-containing protein n=1 Tax=Pseudoalteromonas rubra TaxID=43658 RepID=A0A5S3X3U9_9GAMM|nr:tandem-95 repeat protein [Pseudoalteromonas rubra]TMP38362.1 hypothetical protein CWB98_06420 [Pseudoalteromonas rubra]